MFEGLRVLAARSAFEAAPDDRPPRRGARAVPAPAPVAAEGRAGAATASLHPDLADGPDAPRAPVDLRELDTQVRFCHWDTDEQRREHTREVLRRALSRGGRAPDPDELWAWEQHFEAQHRRQQARNRAEAERLIEERELRAIQGELEKQRIARLGGVDLREYPVLNMHGAMASVVEPFLPFIELVIELLPGVGELVALVQAIEGETLLTGEKLEGVERYLGVALAALPLGAVVAAKGTAVVTAVVADVVRRTGVSAQRAYRLVKGLTRVGPGELELVRAVAGGGARGGADAARARRVLRELTGDEMRGVSGGASSPLDIFASYVDDTRLGADTPARPDREWRPPGALDEHTRARLGEGPRVDAMRERRRHPPAQREPSWQDSQRDVHDDYAELGAESQVAFKDGERVRRGTFDSSQPDEYIAQFKLSIDVKNYDLARPKGVQQLVIDIVKQAAGRTRNLPAGARQAVVIDTRGQQISLELMDYLEREIVRASNGLIHPDNIAFKVE